MSAHKSIIAIADGVQIQAAAEGKGPPRFEVVAYTGGPIRVEGYDLPVVVDLSGLTFSNSLVANLDHDGSKRVGNVTARETTDAGELRLSGLASAATPYRDEVVRSAADGFVWQASIEASPKKITAIAEGQTVSVNGRDVEGPAYHVTQAVLRGFAFVSHGADDNTTVTIAAKADDTTPRKGAEMKAECKEWIEAMGFDVETLTEAQSDALVAQYNGRNVPTPKPPEPKPDGNIDAIVAKHKTEQARVRAITDVAATSMAEHPHMIDDIQAMAQAAIEAKWNAERFELELLRALRPQGNTGFVAGGVPKALNQDVLEAAVAKAAGLPNVDKSYSDQILSAADKHFPNGCGIKQLLIMCAQANGYRHFGTDVTLDVQRAAFGVGANPMVRASGFSTLSTPGILSNIANKFLQRGFMSVDDTWRRISRLRAVRDFKTVTSYTLTGGMTYDKVGPGGELKHGTLGEESYTNKADTYGKMFAITRTDIINDDLNALSDVPMRLGRGAANKLNAVFWTEFLDNSTFFAAGNSNVSTGAGSALALSGLSAAEVVFINQTDPDGLPLGLMPAILLVPPTLKTTGAQLMNSTSLIDGTSTAATGSTNVFAGRYQLETSPYMENSTYTGYSTAAWYLLADPMDLATIEVAFLNGREAPVVETADAAFNVLGVEMRGYHDFGVNLQEYRAGVRSAGS